MSKQSFAVAFLSFALGLLSFAVYRAATTPWSVGGITEPAASIARDIDESKAELNKPAPKKPNVWNRVNPVDMTKEVAESAGPGGRIVLHLAGIGAKANMDHVSIYLEVGLVKHEGTEEATAFHRAHAAELLIESKPMDGTSQASFDVTPLFTTMLASGAEEFRGFTVEFAQVPKNNGVKQTDESFFVQWTYFEIFDAAGNPVAQKPKLPEYDDVAPSRKST
jgi:hypothetical protein